MSFKNYGLDWKWDLGLKNDGTWGVDARGNEVDFDKQVGIYVLKKGPKSVYVGKTGSGMKSGGLIDRLVSHHYDKNKRGKWDRFCWFGMYGVNTKSNKLIKTEDTRLKTSALISDFEAVLIYLMNAKLNKASGRYKHMTEFWRSE